MFFLYICTEIQEALFCLLSLFGEIVRRCRMCLSRVRAIVLNEITVDEWLVKRKEPPGIIEEFM